jgi:hypothetical protein
MCLTGMVRIDGVAYRIMGPRPTTIKPLQQKSVVVCLIIHCRQLTQPNSLDC